MNPEVPVDPETDPTATYAVDPGLARRPTARVVAGGRARPEIGPYFYEPTVLDDVTAAMDCRDDETFGPVVSVYRRTSPPSTSSASRHRSGSRTNDGPRHSPSRSKP